MCCGHDWCGHDHCDGWCLRCGCGCDRGGAGRRGNRHGDGDRCRHWHGHVDLEWFFRLRCVRVWLASRCRQLLIQRFHAVLLLQILACLQVLPTKKKHRTLTYDIRSFIFVHSCSNGCTHRHLNANCLAENLDFELEVELEFVTVMQLSKNVHDRHRPRVVRTEDLAVGAALHHLGNERHYVEELLRSLVKSFVQQTLDFYLLK